MATKTYLDEAGLEHLASLVAAKLAEKADNTAATASAAGLMSASDKSKLDGITASADSVTFSRTLTSGTQIGTLTINGTAYIMYAPSVSGYATQSYVQSYVTTALGEVENGTY